MTLRIHRMLQRDLLDLSDVDQRRLLGLEKRVECLVQPLNFLLAWSKRRDSCVQQVLLNAQELLFDVCGFVERIGPQDLNAPGASSAKPTGPDTGLSSSDQLEFYIKELDFACASVGMAVSIARAVDATPPPLPRAVGAPWGEGHEASGVSLSALLRASGRIQEMRGRSGDLCACSGRLYTQMGGSRASAQGRVDVGDSPPAPARSAGQGPSEEGEWMLVLSLATFKVVASVGVNLNRRKYSMWVESRLPLHRRDYLGGDQHLPQKPLSGAGGERLQHGGLNTSGPLDFPIKASLGASLATTGRLALPSEPSACGARDLGLEALALVWGPGTGAGSPPSDSADALAKETHESTGGLRCAFVFDAPHSGVGVVEASADGPSGTSTPELRSGEAEMALTPLDALYLARLCALDDSDENGGGGSGQECAEAAAWPLHLLSSDEALAELLLSEGGDTVVARLAEEASVAAETRAAVAQAVQEEASGPGL